MKTKSNIKSVDYSIEDVVRIVNIKQQIAYMKAGVYPIDMYVSIDTQADRDIIVMIFLKEDTREVYQKWCNYELG